MRLSADRGPRRIRMWFALSTVLPALAIASLGWMLLAHDRTRERESRRVTREQAADVVVAALQKMVVEWEARLTAFGARVAIVPANSAAAPALISLDRQHAIARDGQPLPFYPAWIEGPARSVSAVIAHAEHLELVERNYAGALRLLLPVTDRPGTSVDPDALLRRARVERRLGQRTAALSTFDRLGALEDVRVGDSPASLVGLQGRALLHASEHDTEAIRKVSTHILVGLERGRWLLTRSQFEFAWDQAARWLGDGSRRPNQEHMAMADAAETIWNEWRTVPSSFATGSRRRLVSVEGLSLLALTRVTDSHLLMLIGGPSSIREYLPARAEGAAASPAVTLTDAGGNLVWGTLHGGRGESAIRSASATGLPWTVHVESVDVAREGPSTQALLMLAGLGIMLVVVVASGYAISRTIARELRVNRLQSDFVAAVSHEFRTPLTTVRHLSELLLKGRVSGDARRAEFYGILVRESHRLQRLVESLMNFARLEAGEVEYRFEALAPGPFLRDVVDDFQRDLGRADASITLHGHGDTLPVVRADREVLARVFWNLLDNAVKYSPERCEVRVDVSSGAGWIQVEVTDRGIGIPAAEQAAIFQKFVRGAAAKAASIRGTGVGLAMAREIVREHGGDITVTSAEGAGSTFTVRLPAAAEPTPSVALAIAPRDPTAAEEPRCL